MIRVQSEDHNLDFDLEIIKVQKRNPEDGDKHEEFAALEKGGYGVLILPDMIIFVESNNRRLRS